MKIYFVVFALLLSLCGFAQSEVEVYVQLPADRIRVTASGEHPGFGVQDIINGKGMCDRFHVSQNFGKTMWISNVATTPVRANKATHLGAVWLMFAMDSVRNIDCIQIWNHNQNDHTKRGLQRVYIECSSDGKKWELIKDGQHDFHILPKAQGLTLEPASFTLERTIRARYICVTADREHGNYYHDDNPATKVEAAQKQQNMDYYGVSEVRFYARTEQKTAALAPVTNVKMIPAQGYLRSKHGARREYSVFFNAPIYAGGVLTVESAHGTQVDTIAKSALGVISLQSSFAPGYMEHESVVKITLRSPQATLTQSINVEGARKWKLHFLAHSHQDIGYTHRQDDVMKLQWRNLDLAMDLAERTADYPQGARYKWNSEATWSVMGYLEEYRGTQRAERLISAIKRGQIGVDASLGSVLTGICKQEELMHIFDDAHKISKMTGVELNTAMMTDAPGQSWGYVTAMAQNGVRYFSSAPNYVPFFRIGGSRVGLYHREWADRPFYWQSQSGNEKVLFWATGKGYSLFHGWLMDKLSVCGVATVWNYLSELERSQYPYATSYLRYTIHGDNGPPDEQMPDLIKQWNEKYEYPNFSISTTTELFSEFEKEYGDHIPTYKGDMTPVWEDGAASTARELAMNRESAERLNQTEILWCMLQRGQRGQFPSESLSEAWKNVVLFSEHTWGASASGPEPESKFTRDLWSGKKAYADSANVQSRRLHEQALSSIGTGKGAYIQVVNTSLWSRTDVVKLDAQVDLEGKSLVDSLGCAIAVQRLDDGRWAFVAQSVPGLSSSVYRIVDNVADAQAKSMVSDNVLCNDIVRVEIDKKRGAISRIEQCTDGYNYASDRGLNNYIYSGRQNENQQTVEQIRQITVLNDGPVAATLRVESEAAGCRGLWRDVTLYKGLDRVDICNTVDRLNVYDYENVRFEFPFNLPNAAVVMDLAWSEMSPERDQLEGANKNFYTIHNGVGLSSVTRGVHLTMVDSPIVELGQASGESWMEDQKQWCAWKTTADMSPTIYSWVMNNSWRTNYKASQEGVARFNYSLSVVDPFRVDYKRLGAQRARELVGVVCDRQQPIAPLFRMVGDLPIGVSTIRPSHDGQGYIVRLENMSKKSLCVQLDWPEADANRVFECDNTERVRGQIDLSSLWFKPYQCITIKVVIKN